MKLQLFNSKDKVLNGLVVVFIVVFLLQMLGKIDIGEMLRDPVFSAIYLLLVTYIADKELVVGLLLGLVYVLMKQQVEGFEDHQATDVSGSENVSSQAETTDIMKKIEEIQQQASSNDASGNDASGNDANGNEANGNDANGNDANGNDATQLTELEKAQQQADEAAKAAEEAKKRAEELQTANSSSDTPTSESGGGDPYSLENIMSTMKDLGLSTNLPNGGGQENFTDRQNRTPQAVQNKLSNIKQNLGKIQNTIQALKQTPNSYN